MAGIDIKSIQLTNSHRVLYAPLTDMEALSEQYKKEIRVALYNLAFTEQTVKSTIDGYVAPTQYAAPVAETPRLDNDQFRNGFMNDSDLTEIAPGTRLRRDAAVGWKALVLAAQQAGFRLTAGSAYRSYEEQEATKRGRGSWAAEAGHSMHGLGIAVDISQLVPKEPWTKEKIQAMFATPLYQWLSQNAGQLGWQNPLWAHDGKRKDEPWHWEYK